MAARGTIFQLRHRIFSSFLKNGSSKNHQNLPAVTTFNRVYSQNNRLDCPFPVSTQSDRLCSQSPLFRVSPVGLQNAWWSTSSQRPVSVLSRLNDFGHTHFSTIAFQLLNRSSHPLFASFRSLLQPGNYSRTLGSFSPKYSEKSLQHPPPKNNAAWHGVRLSNENGFLSYNRNSYLCLVAGATMNVQTIIPHSAEAAIAMFVLGVFNLTFGTAGFLINIRQLRRSMEMSRLAVTTHSIWAVIHYIMYFVIAILYLQTLDGDTNEKLEDVGRSIQSRKLLDWE